MDEFFDAPPLFLTAQQLAGRLGLSVGQVRNLARVGRIPEITVGKNTRRYDVEAVIAALTSESAHTNNLQTNSSQQETPNAY